MNINNNLVDRYGQTLTRRNFLKLGAAAGVVGAGVAMGVPSASWAATAQPKKGGTLKLGLAGGNTTDSYDPGTWSDSFTFVGFSAVYNTLVEIDVDGSVIPELAESWSYTPDARVWTFKLRPGVEFHNGKTMAAADVLASINHHMRPDSTSAAKTVLSEVLKISSPDPSTVVIELKAGNADFAYIMADYHLAIMPAKGEELDWQAGVGTGGYTIKSFDPGVRMVLDRNPNYWKPNRAHFDHAELLGITDGTARINALVTGEVDVINKVDVKTIALLKRSPKVVIEETEGAQHFTFPMLCNSAEFKDNNMRLAMKYAIDRQAILDKILRGYGTVGNDHPIQPNNRFFNKELPQNQYDPDKSRFYLKKAGLDSFSSTLHASEAAYTGAVDASVMFKESAKKAGIDLKVSREPADAFWSSVWMRQPLTTSFFYSSLTADRMFSLGYAKGAAWNETFWDHARFNKLLTQARGELDKNLRQEMYNDMQQICKDEGGSIIPVFANSVAARTKRVTHSGTTAPYGELDGLRIIERWWVA